MSDNIYLVKNVVIPSKCLISLYFTIYESELACYLRECYSYAREVRTMVLELGDLEGKVFDVLEVAKLLGITPDSVRLRIRKGHLPARRVAGDRGYAIDGGDLAAYLRGTPYYPAGRRRRQARATVPEQAGTEGGAVPFRLPPESKDRLRAWMSATGRDQRTVAAESGINESSLSFIVGSGARATRALCRDNALRLRDTYGATLLEWLLGTGPMPTREG